MMRAARRRATRAVQVAALALSLGCPQDQHKDDAPPIRIDAERYRVDLREGEQAKGADAPLVTIVVFSDFACPPCGRLWQVLDHVVEHRPEDVRVVFRSYTVPGFAGGEQAAEAAYAAGEQGKFWEMHAALFGQLEQGGGFDRPTLRAHAEALGLDVPRFLDELDTGVHAARRGRDRRVATELGIRGLPVTFVNGLYLPGFIDEKTMDGIVAEEITRAKALVDEGVARADLYATLMAKAATKPVGEHDAAKELRADMAKQKAAAEPKQQLVAPKGDARYRIEPGAAPLRGPADAPVVIVEFVDFQCPFCRRAHKEEIAALLERHPNDVALAIRHLPLPIHNAAQGAAKAAIAAGAQGKFWELHDKLLAHEGSVGRSAFVAWADELGLDQAKFLAVLDDPATAAIVDGDTKLANAVGVAGTPGFFVNGRYLDGFAPGALSAMVDEELARANERIAKGTARADVFREIMAEAIPESEFPNR
jgi:protein-disulfide isomerase